MKYFTADLWTVGYFPSNPSVSGIFLIFPNFFLQISGDNNWTQLEGQTEGSGSLPFRRLCPIFDSREIFNSFSVVLK